MFEEEQRQSVRGDGVKTANRKARPLIRYHGGKWLLAPWIISHFPEHRNYVEPFGGGGSVLLRKPRTYAEVYNDLDCEIVNLFQVARDRGPELVNVLTMTPFARKEFELAWHPSEDALEQARRTVIRAFMGFGSAAATMRRSVNQKGRGGLAKTGFRNNSDRSGTTPAHDWNNYPSALVETIARLKGVVIENKPALDLIRQMDRPHTLFYVDPPYLPETRDAGGDYRHEMTEQDHRDLAALLNTVQGAVILSGYPSALYEDLYRGWRRVEREALADGARKRTEVLWMRNVPEQETSLFHGVAA